MLIGVDAGALGIKDERLKVGVYQYSKELLENLGKIDKKNHYLLYSFNPISKDDLRFFGPNMENIVVRPSRGWSKLWLPLRIKKDKIDLFLALSQAVPLNFGNDYKIIGTVYDISFEYFPQNYNDYKRLKRESNNLARKSDLIVAISEFTKKQLVKNYNVKINKIKVIYPGLRKLEKYSSNQEKKDYFLFVGALKKSKNISNIIKGYNYFWNNSKSKINLIIAGGNKWPDSEIVTTLDNLNPQVKKNIKLLGHVSESRLISLYANAFAFVSPSIYEGFGLTHLEAASRGIPIIAANQGSMPEVLRNAAIYVNPNKPSEIGSAMLKLEKDKVTRNKLSKAGISQSKKFSWSMTAKKYLQIIENE